LALKNKNVIYEPDTVEEQEELEKISDPQASAKTFLKKDRRVTGKKEKKEKKEALLATDGTKEKQYYFGEERKTIRDLIAFEGLDTSAEEFVKIINAGNSIPTVCMYVHTMPKQTTFAYSYVPLFNFSGVSTSVFIKPMSHDEAQKNVDGRVSELSVQVTEAHKAGDVNQERKMANKLKEAHAWASAIERGDNALYKVKFVFVLQDLTTEGLNRKINLFHAKANEIGFNVVCAYATHHHVLRSHFPLNRPYEPKKDSEVIAEQVLDKYALADLFNHTDNAFIHKDGVFAGHYINGNKVFLYDPYDKSHDGFGVAIAGSTGTGKSATIKMLQSRLGDFGVRFRTVDVESKLTEGEYAGIARAMGGINFEIKSGSKNILNPFDINVELEYDEKSGMEFEVLHLNDKLVYLEDLFISMVTVGRAAPDVALEQSMRAIIADTCSRLYEERGIYDGVPDSLFTSSGKGLLSSGREKKELPTVSDAFRMILIERHLNQNVLLAQAYQTLIDSVASRVKEVYYSEKTCRFFTREQYNAMNTGMYGRKVTKTPDGEDENVIAVRGAKAYFDGQSTMSATTDTPYVNYDISQVPQEDKAFSVLVVMGYMEVNDVRRNSANKNNIQKMVVLLDELHTVFPYQEARRIVERFYRTARKRHVSPWSATQSLKDYAGYKETEAILENAESIFLFRHSEGARDFLRKNTQLNNSQVERVLKLGYDPKDTELTEEEKNRKRGEVCIIDKGRAAFIKMDYLKETEASYVETDASKYSNRVA